MQHAPPNRLGGVVDRSAAPEAAVGPPGLELIEVTKRLGAIPALDRVSLQVRPGCVLGFLGPNGAGKTSRSLGAATSVMGSSWFVGGRGLSPAPCREADRGVFVAAPACPCRGERDG
jgi:hypothetical protein